LLIFCCQSNPATPSIVNSNRLSEVDTPYTNFKPDSWQYFLQHLPLVQKEVVDFKGRAVSNQSKSFAVVDYDIGSKDLQQCADALMRLRAEYLFKQKRTDEIGFHFTSGDLYTFKNYCKGIRPVIGRNTRFVPSAVATERTHGALRTYLDIIYTYAGTISLYKELKPVNSLTVGTIAIKPGSPGHCFIIVDEAMNSNGESVYKLLEGYTPAQSIYVLRNEVDGSAWHKLDEHKPIRTASYYFETYALKSFE
jgi:hypothetical protein